MERPEFYEALGRTIQVMRTDRGMDRKSLARAVGISYSYLAGIETGQKRPSSRVLLGLASALGLRSDQLMAATEQRFARGASPPPAAAMPVAAAGAPLSAAVDEFTGPIPEKEDPTSGSEPPSAPSRPPPEDAGEFLHQIAGLARDLSPEDRRLILETARRLVGQGR